MHTHRGEIRKLGDALAEHDAEHSTFTFVSDHAMFVTMDSEAATSSEAPGKQRRPSMTRRSVDLLWLSSKIDKFQSRSWWAGSFLIGMRITQTSIMVFIVNPGLQATAASLVALVGVAVQMHTAPYRRPSDNHSALASAWLLFIWSFVLLVRYTGAVNGEHGVVLGALPIAATVAIVTYVAYALAMDVRKDAPTEDDADREAKVTVPESVAEEEAAGPAADAQRSTTETAVSDVEMTALASTAERYMGRPPPSSTGEDGTGLHLDATSPADFNFFRMLCVVEQKQPGDTASTTATCT